MLNITKIDTYEKFEEISDIFYNCDSSIRLGKLFCTEKKSYFYDSGTGKVLECTADEFKVLKWFLDNKPNGSNHYYDFMNFKRFMKHLSLEELGFLLQNLKHEINSESLLQAPAISFNSKSCREEIESALNNMNVYRDIDDYM